MMKKVMNISVFATCVSLLALSASGYAMSSKPEGGDDLTTGTRSTIPLYSDDDSYSDTSTRTVFTSDSEEEDDEKINAKNHLMESSKEEEDEEDIIGVLPNDSESLKSKEEDEDSTATLLDTSLENKKRPPTQGLRDLIHSSSESEEEGEWEEKNYSHNPRDKAIIVIKNQGWRPGQNSLDANREEFVPNSLTLYRPFLRHSLNLGQSYHDVASSPLRHVPYAGYNSACNTTTHFLNQKPKTSGSSNTALPMLATPTKQVRKINPASPDKRIELLYNDSLSNNSSQTTGIKPIDLEKSLGSLNDSKVKDLDLSNGGFSSMDFDSIIKAIPNSPLTSLNLSGNNWTYAHVLSLMYALKSSPPEETSNNHIKYIDITGVAFAAYEEAFTTALRNFIAFTNQFSQYMTQTEETRKKFIIDQSYQILPSEKIKLLYMLQSIIEEAKKANRTLTIKIDRGHVLSTDPEKRQVPK